MKLCAPSVRYRDLICDGTMCQEKKIADFLPFSKFYQSFDLKLQKKSFNQQKREANVK
jgi:hypothetical protein